MLFSVDFYGDETGFPICITPYSNAIKESWEVEVFESIKLFAAASIFLLDLSISYKQTRVSRERMQTRLRSATATKCRLFLGVERIRLLLEPE